MTNNFWSARVVLLAAVCALPAALPLAAQSPAKFGVMSGASEKPKPAAAEAPTDETEQYRHSPMVAKLGSMVGMDTKSAATAFTLSNLAILVLALGYGLMKSLPGTFKSRSTGLKKQLTEARSATQEAQSRLSSVEARLAKLDDQIATMRHHAELDIETAGQKVKAAAEAEKARILADANLEIQSATAAARRELMKYAAELAVNQAASKLSITPDADRMLIQSFATALPTKNGSQN